MPSALLTRRLRSRLGCQKQVVARHRGMLAKKYMRFLYYCFLPVFFVSVEAKTKDVEQNHPELAEVLEQDKLADIAVRNPKAELYRLTVRDQSRKVSLCGAEQSIYQGIEHATER